MSDERLDREERELLERLSEAYAPRPLDAARRAALDERVRARIERGRFGGARAPALVAASVAALALAWVALPGGGPRPATDPPGARAESANADEWESRLFEADLTGVALEDDEARASLPPEYAAIDSLFFDG